MMFFLFEGLKDNWCLSADNYRGWIQKKYQYLDRLKKKTNVHKVNQSPALESLNIWKVHSPNNK